MAKFYFIICLTLLTASCFSASSEAEEKAWKETTEVNTLEALDSFIMVYPKTKHSKEIAKKRDAILWQIAKQKKTEYHYNYYLREFPQGDHHVEATAALKAMPIVQNLDLAALNNKTFVGTIRYKNEQELEVIALKFKSLDKSSKGINFIANIHLSHDIKKELQGTIELPNLRISFEENQEDKLILGFSNGRIYVQNERFLIESIDPKQYWILR